MTGGYGSGGWGSVPWGSRARTTPSEVIPTSKQWDIFDLSGVRTPNDINRLLTYTEVAVVGDGASFFEGSFNIASGGAYPSATAALLINVAVPPSFTLTYDLVFHNLPPDFSGATRGAPLTNSLYLGAWGYGTTAAGFLISQAGWAYTGELVVSGTGDAAPAQPVAAIPGSDTWTQEGVEYYIRVVADATQLLLYLFITPVLDLAQGERLQAILPLQNTVSEIPDEVAAVVHGDVSTQVWVELKSYQFSSKVLVPVLPPVADAGKSKTLLRCSILQLDGRQSHDPQGLPLTYEWRLVDAPFSSTFVISCGDGSTGSSATGFSNTLYSSELAAVDAEEPISALDVLELTSGAYTIVNVTHDPTFSVQVQYDQLPASVTGLQFKVLRQTGINNRDSVNPTFYPDVLGFFTFDLRVNNGLASSDPLGLSRSPVLINVLESPLPRGCAVDASFLFEYMYSAWQLVDDRDRIAVLWEGIARTAASELYTLWQYEYSKSLRDIQRTFVRRWLHYDALLPEPSPELTTVRFIWGGVISAPIQGTVSGVAGTQLVVGCPFLSADAAVTLQSAGSVPPGVYAAELTARLQETLGPSSYATVWWTRAELFSGVVAWAFPGAFAGRTLRVSVDGGGYVTATAGSVFSSAELVSDLAAQLPGVSVTLTAAGTLRLGSRTVGGISAVAVDVASTLLVAHGGPLSFSATSATTLAYLHLVSNVPFMLKASSTAPAFSYPSVNKVIGDGAGGETVSDRTFRASYSLVDAALREDDLLILGAAAYRIVRLLDNPDDTFAFQRVVVKDPLPSTSAGGVEWVIPGWVTSTFLNFWRGLVARNDHVDFEVQVPVGDQQALSLAATTAFGVNVALPTRLAVDTAVLAAQLSLNSGTTVRLARVLRRRYVPVDSRIVDVPVLTDVIAVTDTDSILQRNIDYFLTTFRGQSALQFVSGEAEDPGDVFEGARPPVRYWAEYTFVDNSDLIEANFGAAIGLTRDKVPETVDYLSAVRGLWYARYNGPTMDNLRIALQIFLGLPFAEEAGTITEIRNDFLSRQGRILVQDTSNSELVRSYTYPSALSIEFNPSTGKPYAVGDTVTQFAPLVTGAEIVDYVKDPVWFSGILSQGIFYEPQKYHTFLVRVDSTVFTLPSLIFAQQFINGDPASGILGFKPKDTMPLYVIEIKPNVKGDDIEIIDEVELALTLSLYESPCDYLGQSHMVDQPWAASVDAGKSWRNQFDTGFDPSVPPPVYPGPSDEVFWGFDKNTLCPLDVLDVLSTEVYDGSSMARVDSGLRFDTTTATVQSATQASTGSYPSTFTVLTLGSAGTLTRVSVQLLGLTAGTPQIEPLWHLVVRINGTAVATKPFSIGYTHPVNGFILTLPQNIELVLSSLSISVAVDDVLSIVIEPVSGNTQGAGWTQLTVLAAVSSTLWHLDTVLPAGLYGDFESIS